MNIAIASINDADLPEIKRRLGTDLVYTSTQSDLERKRADIAIQIDEDIFLKDQQIDLVVEVHHLDQEIEKLVDERFVLIKDKLIMFPTDTIADVFKTPSFACSPEVYSLLSTQYKINFDELFYNYVKECDYVTYRNKFKVLAMRMGISFHVV